MADEDAAGRHRPRRSTAATQRLHRMRENQARLDAERRDKQQREDAALERFADQDAKVSKCERHRDQVVAGLEERIEREQAQAGDEIAKLRSEQACHLRELRAVGRSPAEIATLVEWPLKQVQRMLRQSATTSVTSARPTKDEKPRSISREHGQTTSASSGEAGERDGDSGTSDTAMIADAGARNAGTEGVG